MLSENVALTVLVIRCSCTLKAMKKTPSEKYCYAWVVILCSKRKKMRYKSIFKCKSKNHKLYIKRCHARIIESLAIMSKT